MAYEDEEQIEQLRRFWDRYGVPILVCGGLAIAGATGWRWYESHARASAERAAVDYQQILGAADFADARAQVDALRGAHGGSDYVVLADFHLAALAITAQDLAAAEAALRDALERADHPADEHLARLRLARVVLDRGDAPGAADLIAGMTAVAFAADYAELRGDIAHARGDVDGARMAWREALAAAGDGARANLIKLKLDDLGS